MGDKGKKTKARGNNRKRPSLIKRKNENRKKKRRNKCPVALLVCHFLLRGKRGRWIHRSSATPEVSEEGLGGG